MINSALASIERAGNRLPHPSGLFFLLSVAVVFASAIFTWLNVQATHPITKETIVVFNLMSTTGLQRILSEAIHNFMHFAPVGPVLIAMLGIGIAEHSGLIHTTLRGMVSRTPKRALSFVVVITGVLSSIAADAGYVVLIPLSALVFIAADRHPLAGMAAAFAGVSGGYSANLMIGPVDVILSGISTEAAQFVDAHYEVSAADNYFFIIASTFLIGLVGTWVTERIVEPRLGDYGAQNTAKDDSPVSHSSMRATLNEKEKRGLWWAGISALVFCAIIAWCVIPENGVLRHPETGSIKNSPFMRSLITLIAIAFAIAGIAYGFASRTFKSNNDIIEGMEKSMATMASYLVLMFFAAQFVAYFKWSELGIISAVNAADVLGNLNIPLPMLLLSFIFITATLNLLIGSASAKWTLMAPVFVPMFMLLGISPELTQAAYRLADSSTNIITPLMPYFGIVVAFMQRYEKSTGIGTVTALMLPYSLAFLLSWSIMLLVWSLLGIPLGESGRLFIP